MRLPNQQRKLDEDLPHDSHVQGNWAGVRRFCGTTIQRMKSNELSKVLQRATALFVSVGTYYGDLEAYTASQGLVLETKEARFVLNPVISLFLALGMTEMSLCGDTDRKLVADLADLKWPSIIRRISEPQRSSFIRSLAGYNGRHVQTSDGMYWRHALNGEVYLLAREEEEPANLHFALWDRTEAIDEGEVCVLTCYE
jgi:hypothetical protein